MSSIQWTDETWLEAEHLGYRAITEEERPQLLPPLHAKSGKPLHGIAVTLRAVARPARGHNVARCRLPTGRDRDEVVDARRICGAVGAPLGQQFLAPLSWDRVDATPSRGCTSTPVDVTPISVPLALTLTLVGPTEAVADIGHVDPPSAATAPREAHRSHLLPLEARRSVRSRVKAARGGQPVGARAVQAERCLTLPVATETTPLPASRPVGAVLGERHADASGGALLGSCLATHVSHSRTEV